MSKRRQFQGYGVLDDRRKLIWGTLFPSEDMARSQYEKHNRTPEGEPMPYTLVKATVFLDEIPE